MVRTLYIDSTGDYGDKFYILIEGSVSILVPKKRDKPSEDDSLKRKESPFNSLNFSKK